MHTVFLRTICVLLLGLLLAACGSPPPMTRTAYVGEWVGKDMRLAIDAKGNVDYQRKKANGQSSITAPISKWDGDDFVVGVAFMTTRFVVSRPPTEKEGVWTMVVDGVELRRVKGGADHVWT
jgi:hypothetical protein